MVIRVADLTTAADTESHGNLVASTLLDAMRSGNVVTVSFSGIHSVTSSFVNAAFLPLLREFSFDEIKRRMRVTHSTAQINDMVKRRLTREASELSAAA